MLLLGALSLVTPFAVDMYLPAFDDVAVEFGTTAHAVSFSLSTYFIGFAFGQVFYGPLLDRFGRKRPVCFGLAIFVLASLGCAFAPGLRSLIFWRLLQALGGCSAQVGSTAMVRDFFPAKESARIFSLLFLIIGVSPLLAPTAGVSLLHWVGWRWIFAVLGGIAALSLALTWTRLPEGHVPDATVSLRPVPMFRTFAHVFERRQFSTYALAGAFSFAGLFAYVASAPLLFIDGFHVSKNIFGVIFATVTMGFIGANQLNVGLLRRFTSEQIFFRALLLQVATGAIFFLGTRLGWIGFWGTLALFFVFLSCTGLIYPNAAALALRPFSRNVGSASALLGFIQMGVGALISTGIGFFGAPAVVPLLAAAATLALVVFAVGRRGLEETAAPPLGESVPVTH